MVYVLILLSLLLKEDVEGKRKSSSFHSEDQLESDQTAEEYRQAVAKHKWDERIGSQNDD